MKHRHISRADAAHFLKKKISNPVETGIKTCRVCQARLRREAEKLGIALPLPPEQLEYRKKIRGLVKSPAEMKKLLSRPRKKS